MNNRGCLGLFLVVAAILLLLSVLGQPVLVVRLLPVV